MTDQNKSGPMPESTDPHTVTVLPEDIPRAPYTTSFIDGNQKHPCADLTLLGVMLGLGFSILLWGFVFVFGGAA